MQLWYGKSYGDDMASSSNLTESGVPHALDDLKLAIERMDHSILMQVEAMKALSVRYESMSTDVYTMHTDLSIKLKPMNIRVDTFNNRVNKVEPNQTFNLENTRPTKNTQRDRTPPGRDDGGQRHAHNRRYDRYDFDDELGRRHRNDDITKKVRHDIRSFDGTYYPLTFSD